MPAPKMSVIGDSIRLVPAGSPALFELSALGFNSNEIDVQIISTYLKLSIFTDSILYLLITSYNKYIIIVSSTF